MDLNWNKVPRLRRLIPSALARRIAKEPASSTNKLCAICAKHNFRKLLAPALDPLPSQKWQTRYSTAHVQEHSQTCPFCRLLCHLAGALKPHDGVSVVRKTINITREYKYSFIIVERSRQWHVPCLVVDSFERIQMVYQPEGSSRHLLRDRLFRARPLKEFADVDLLKEWLSTCKEKHVECWKTGKSPRKEDWMEHDIRLIDIEKGCVVKITGPCEYVALSYVWGGPDIPQLKLVKSTTQRLFTEGGLPNSHADVPTTISDTMEFTRRLGKKYLWVDAVCIEQDNREDQGEQIGQMHKIYSNALLTIVAGYGLSDIMPIEKRLVANSWIGLPGVRKARDGQMIESVQGLQLANLGWLFSGQMNASEWNYRAWTFQELQFSKRLVFFTKHQIFYRCEEALWREDQHLETDTTVYFNILDTPESTEADPQRHSFKQWFGATDIDAFTQYKELAGGICRRVLTNQDDILAAFSGIANTLKETMHCDFIWGLPSAYFDLALLFQSTARAATFRRKGFPSWSWTGWLSFDTTTPHLPRGPNIIYIPDGDTRRFYAELEWYTIQEGEYRKISNTKVVYARTFRQLDAIRSLWRPPQLDDLPGSVPELSKQELERLLVFQTSSAFVKIEANTLTAGLYDALFSADGDLRTINRRKNSPAWIQRKMSPDTTTVTVEFIVVGTVAASPDDLSSSAMGNHEATKAHLSLIAIETDEKGISQRIGVVDGTVNVRDWLDYRPVWRAVFLL